MKKSDSFKAVFFDALKNYASKNNSAWHTPGHSGGAFFLRSNAGREFLDFVGENVCKADLSVSVEELGSLLGHSGLIGAAEKNAAKVFGADRTFFVLDGTSAVNQIIFGACAGRGDTVVVDRNCHKSVYHALISTGARPIYISPVRNAAGLIGPIRKADLSAKRLAGAAADGGLCADAARVRLMTLTNSNYDGVCSKTSDFLKLNVAANLHFDEAWFAHAKFSPVYSGFFALDDSARADCPVFVSQSTHKMLAAFSQGSMLHIKEGAKRRTVAGAIDETYAMHTSTSPQYNIIASLDITGAIMSERGGALAEETVSAAVRLRREIARRAEAARAAGDWYFDVWQPRVVETSDGSEIPFCEADEKYLAGDSRPWLIRPHNQWHGFSGLGESDIALLDPLKITITTEGFDARCGAGSGAKRRGIPAKVVARFLASRGVVCEKTDLYSFLMLHSFGIGEVQHARLLDALDEFKKLYDADAPLEDAIPELVRDYPSVYSNVGLREHCDKMDFFIQKAHTAETMNRAFGNPPRPKMTPADAFKRVVDGKSEYVPIRETLGRISAAAVIPYPPGVPLIFGGELWGEGDCAIAEYLSDWEDFENEFKGYETEIMGVERRFVNGRISFAVLCLAD